jgi:hypothetical protein
MNRPPEWRRVFWVNPCTFCGAGIGEPCVTKTGHEYALVHHARAIRGRCPSCGAPLGPAQLDGDLCPRCQLVRDLEAERATTWKRQDP